MSRRLTAEDLWEIPRVGAPCIDPRGLVLVVPVTSYSHDGTATTRLWRIDEGDAQPLTAPRASASEPAISPDGSTLAFVRKVDDVAQIHVMALDGGEPEAITNFPLGATGPKWLPVGSGVVCLGTVYRDALSLEDAAARPATRRVGRTTAHVTEGRFFRYWDEWLTDGRIPHLFVVDPATHVTTDVTPESTVLWEFEATGTPGLQFDISPDGAEVVYSAVRSDDPDAQPTYVIRTVPVGGGEPRVISADGPGSATSPRYTADGSTIVYGRQRRDDFYADRVRLVAHDRKTGRERMLAEDWDRSPNGWVPAADGTIVFSAEDAGGAKVFSLTSDDEAPQGLTAGGSASSVAAGGGRIVFLHQSLTTPPEIYEVAVGPSRRLTHFTDAALDGVRLGSTRSVHYAGHDDTDIQMFVVTPPDFEPSIRRPLVHLIHGGPHGMSGDAWHWRWNAQVIAAAGYVTAMVNFHGSTSWGQAFAESILGEWGHRPFADVEAATNTLIADGLVDPDRMAVTGGSYGGYLASWIVSQTDRYRCAIAHAAVTNLSGMYASDLVFHRASAYGAEYWEDPARVDRWSPASHAAGYSTPTLVVHGERDYRVPVTQGLELYGILKAKGVEARLVYYPDENHWILSRANSVHWYGEFLGWLRRHLQPE